MSDTPASRSRRDADIPRRDPPAAKPPVRHRDAKRSSPPRIADEVDVALMDSFPCSDPPSYNTSAA